MNVIYPEDNYQRLNNLCLLSAAAAGRCAHEIIARRRDKYLIVVAPFQRCRVLRRNLQSRLDLAPPLLPPSIPLSAPAESGVCISDL